MDIGGSLSHKNWFDKNRHNLTKGGLWLRGDEPNRLPVSQWEERPFRVLLSRLSTWNDTLESFTHRLLYSMLRDLPEVFPDLAWVPPHHDGEVMTEAGVPWLLGSGTKRGVEEFDCLAFSNALVQETVNIAVMLERSGIPLSRRERMARQDLPLVIMGGANSLYASALFSEDPMVDGIFIGEEPDVIQSIFVKLAEAKRNHASKPEMIAALMDVPGFFVPDTAQPVTKKNHASKPDLNKYKTLEMVVAAEGVAGTASLQISEGCPYFCSFCAESWSRKPYREVGLETARREALDLKRELGLTKIDLYSFNFNTYEHIRPLVGGLLEDFNGVGLKSQRFDAIAHDQGFARLLKIAGKSSITCGLEGISPRMRKFLQKDLSEDELYRSLASIFRERQREIKVFLIATGREEEEDYAEFKIFLKRLRELWERAASRPRVIFSATPLVRFPWTPLEFDDMIDPRELSRKVGYIKAAAVSAGFEFRGSAGIEEAWVSQVLVRARDGRVMEAVRAAQAKTGFVFRDVITEEFYETLRQELTDRHGDPDAFVRGFGDELVDEQPWSNLDPGVARRFLVREWKRCQEFVQTTVCLGWVDEPGKCHACGACTPPEREAITHARTEHGQDLDVLDKKLRALRATETVVPVAVELSDACTGLPMDLIHAWHARAWMKVLGVVREYRRHEPHGRQEESEDCIAAGRETLNPVFWADAADKVRMALADEQILSQVNELFAPYGKVLGAAEVLPADGVWSLVSSQPPDLSGWLGSRGLKHTMRRDGVAKIYDLPKESIKKKLAKSIRSEEGVDGIWRTRLESGEKFSPRDFLKGAVPGDLRAYAVLRRES
ncbi:MAG: hypothetical protein RL173_3407 [Fibrobacterota bacterium]|jgi:radical SAM superfamily enzyme YgiQ (UPF0313 family)